MINRVGSALSRFPWQSWRPKLVECLRGYGRESLIADAVAGLTVGVVALPLAMAFGIASGVTPQAGIYTAVVGGFIVSLLGGSRRSRLAGLPARSSSLSPASLPRMACRAC